MIIKKIKKQLGLIKFKIFGFQNNFKKEAKFSFGY